VKFRDILNKILINFEGQSPEDVIDREAILLLNEMVRDEQQGWVSENTLAVLGKLLDQREPRC
jgi:hypothetical protein